MAYMEEVLGNIESLTNGFWLIYPSYIQITFGKDQIPEFRDETQYHSWLENRIRDALSCPSMIRLNNFVERWSLRVRIEPSCDVCKDNLEDMLKGSTVECKGCFRTPDDYEPLGSYQEQIQRMLVVEFYDNPLAKGDAIATIDGWLDYQADPKFSNNANARLRLSTMVQTYLKKTPNRLINKSYQVDRAYISQVMRRRFHVGDWIDEHSYTPRVELPRWAGGKNYVELRYDKPPGFGYKPSWKSVLHSDSLLSLFG